MIDLKLTIDEAALTSAILKTKIDNPHTDEKTKESIKQILIKISQAI